MEIIAHPMNWLLGWWLLVLAFLTGAALGLGFHKPEFMGGYDSFRRRITRLGHIALAALGMLNIIYGLSPLPPPGTLASTVGTWGLAIGGISMPTVCFLSAWKEPLRQLFFIPVISLLSGVLAVAIYGVMA